MKTYIQWAFVYDRNHYDGLSYVEFWSEITEDAEIVFNGLIRIMNIPEIVGCVKLEQRQAEHLERYEFWGKIKTISKVRTLMIEKWEKIN